jgi:hypothetical protein
MNELTIESLQEKIKKVEEDLNNESGRKYEILMEYKKYLEDEIEMLKREARQ